MYLRIHSHPLLQIYLQNINERVINKLNFKSGHIKTYSANKFAVTGANKFANTMAKTIALNKQTEQQNPDQADHRNQGFHD
jgi:hypothetical protein